MKKTIVVVACIAAVAVCAIAAYNSAAESETNASSESTALNGTAAVRDKHGKVLVAYFSVPETDGVDASSGASRIVSNGRTMGSTHYVASVISEATGGDFFEIKTTHTYPGTHKALIDAAKKEADNSARPRLATHIKNLKDYDVVFVGFPNWWYDMPMSLYSFFDEYDFSGKTVIPFCTHGGSRFSGAVETIRELEPKATVLDGHAIARDRVDGSRDGVLRWLKKTGMRK